MKYLVLGAAGQIGSVLVPYLEQYGHNAWGLDTANSSANGLSGGRNPQSQ